MIGKAPGGAAERKVILVGAKITYVCAGLAAGSSTAKMARIEDLDQNRKE